MPNRDNAQGFQLVGRTHDGGEIQLVRRTKVVGYGTALFPGDVVNRVASGALERSITPGTTLITGVNQNHGAASTATDHLVCEQMGALFVAQGDDGTNLDEVDMGLNANVILQTGSAALKQSRDEIDSSTKATTNTLDLKLHERWDKSDNAYGEFAKIIVTFNKHRMGQSVAGV